MFLVVACQSVQGLAFGGMALFLPIIRSEFGLSFTQAGSIAAASTVVYAFMQIPSGYLADRFGPKRLFVIGLVGTNLLAFAFSLLNTYWTLLANQALSGLFRALVFAPGLLLIGALFPLERRATAMGLYVAGGFSSNVVLNILGPVLVGPVGWRRLFEAFSIAGLAVVVLYWRFGSPGPHGTGKGQLPAGQMLRLLRHRVMMFIAVIQYVRLSVVIGLAYWLPTVIVVDKGRSLQFAGLLVALGAAMTAPANFLGGYLSDRLKNPLLIIGASQFMLAITTALIVLVNGVVPLIAVIAINGIFVQFYFGPLFAVPIDMLGLRTAGLTSGFGNFFANLGGLTFVYVLGFVKDVTGSFAPGLYSLSVLCCLGVASTVVLARIVPASTR